MSKFLDIFKNRGFFFQATDEDSLKKLDNITAYIGFDCTADSLHVGSLMQIMILRWLKATGNTPIVLLGGGTTKVGDPSGKDETRKILTADDIEKNKAGIRKIFEQFGLGDCQIVDNAEWLDKLNYIEFLRDIGKHFSVNRMLSMDSVKMRLDREQNLSFLEFNYMILQAYDFVELNKKYGCRLQIGGSDQWGNIINGIELNDKILINHKPIQKISSDSDGWIYTITSGDKVIAILRDGEEASNLLAKEIKSWDAENKLFGLTTPLITTSSGAKMGKTAAGAVWLDAGKVSPYDYYQFWRNTEDADVIKFLKIFTEISLEQIDEMKTWEGSAKINDAKKILAFEATKLCHGEAEAHKAEQTAITAFEQGGTAGLPEVTLEAKTYKAYELFVAAGLATSNGESRRLIAGGGAKIDDVKVESDSQEIMIKDGMKLSSGKKKHVVVKC